MTSNKNKFDNGVMSQIKDFVKNILYLPWNKFNLNIIWIRFYIFV